MTLNIAGRIEQTNYGASCAEGDSGKERQLRNVFDIPASGSAACKSLQQKRNRNLFAVVQSQFKVLPARIGAIFFREVAWQTSRKIKRQICDFINTDPTVT